MGLAPAVTGWARDTAAALADLVLPAGCAGCGRAGATGPICAGCAAGLDRLVPYRTRPTPAPRGMPDCWTLGGYEGVLRECLLAYKERGRSRLAGPLGGLLARGVRAAVGTRPVLLVPVPATAAAIRARYGDHVLILARRAAAVLSRDGQPAAAAPLLRARPRPDSTRLDAMGRARAAEGAFLARPDRLRHARTALTRGADLVIVDDIVTTGATLATITELLGVCGVTVCHAVVVGATRRRREIA